MLQASELRKTYATPEGPLEVLSGVSLTLEPGDAVAIVGPSGSGKSTLLHILGGLDPPTSGSVTLDGRDPYALSERDLNRFRNREIGFVFQDSCLLPQCSALENVLVPTFVSGNKADFVTRGRVLLDQVGLGPRGRHRPAQLSGGEKQRVALARALILEPRLLLCDEPTGNLDRQSAETVASVLFDLHRKSGAILVVVTHSAELAARVPRRFALASGQLQPA